MLILLDNKKKKKVEPSNLRMMETSKEGISHSRENNRDEGMKGKKNK